MSFCLGIGIISTSDHLSSTINACHRDPRVLQPTGLSSPPAYHSQGLGRMLLGHVAALAENDRLHLALMSVEGMSLSRYLEESPGHDSLLIPDI